VRIVLYHLLNVAKREFSSVLVTNIKIVGIKFSLEISLALLCDPIIRSVGSLDEFCVGQRSPAVYRELVFHCRLRPREDLRHPGWWNQSQAHSR